MNQTQRRSDGVNEYYRNAEKIIDKMIPEVLHPKPTPGELENDIFNEMLRTGGILSVYGHGKLRMLFEMYPEGYYKDPAELRREFRRRVDAELDKRHAKALQLRATKLMMMSARLGAKPKKNVLRQFLDLLGKKSLPDIEEWLGRIEHALSKYEKEKENDRTG